LATTFGIAGMRPDIEVSTAAGIPEEVLFLEWARVVRKLKKIRASWNFEGRASIRWVLTREDACTVTKVPEAMRDFAMTHGCESRLADVLELIRLG